MEDFVTTNGSKLLPELVEALQAKIKQLVHKAKGINHNVNNQ